ncbi:MAG TPA: hypothetical protein VL201_02865 [Patescibacteria group bacterium]|jgi:hypothetical protein|nr:hypothetical protein [Patescibacteria group bacterium]
MLGKYKICVFNGLYLLRIFGEELPVKGISFLSNRPQYLQSGKDLTMWHEQIHQHKQNKKNSMLHFAFTARYSQSFKNAQIAETLFGSSILHIAGSGIQERPVNSLVADYFGLSPKFKSTIFIRPSIKTGMITTDILWSLKNHVKGLYIKASFPFCVSKQSLGLHEVISPEATSSPFPVGYMDTNGTATNPSAQSFIEAIVGQSQTGTLQPLTKGKIKSQHKIGLADIPILLGWQPIQNDLWGLALEFIGLVPTGSRPKNEFLFEPIIGNEKQPAVGAGITSYIKIWEELEQDMHLYLTGYFYHFFKSIQYRSFDFKYNGFLSRYLLIKEFDTHQTATGNIIPAINITTLKCHVHNALVFDGTLFFAYTHNNFFTDFGYNGFIKSKDKIEIKETIPLNTYGIKGTQFIFDPLTNLLDSSTASRISITEGSLIDQTTFKDAATVFINTQDLCIDSARVPLTIVHTFFASIGYRKQEDFVSRCLPFCGIGAEVSLEGLDLDHFSSITKHSISQWSLYFKGGFSY